MYLGNPDSTWSSQSPEGSYAVEAEGLTVVKNDFYANLLKGFFTMGKVAFGAQYMPADGSIALSVGGNAQTWNSIKAQGVGIDGQSNYQGQIGKEGPTKVWGQTAGGPQTSSVYRYDFGSNPLKDVDWNNDNAKSFSVNGTDYSNYGTTISDLSSQLNQFVVNGKTAVGTAEAKSDYTRYKYDGTVKATFAIPTNSEKLITFTGDNVSNLQVFQVKASDLTSDGYNGLDFAFNGVPAGASVVVNVVDSNGAPYKGPIPYQQGWRFWWNGTEISNGYVENTADNTYGALTAVNDDMRSRYSAAAQSIMWNYSGATSVEIKGSQATGINGNIVKNGSAGWAAFNNATATDDPSSAVLGSILVPRGNLTTHVTTNGRVWVGGNYAMFNPASSNVKQGSLDIVFGSNKSASIVDMDQERHNFPWSASTTSDCSTISWNKVVAGTESGGNPTKLAGSQWAVYGSYPSDSTTLPLLTITDNGSNDWDSAEGQLKVQGLEPHAGYYLKETQAPDGYQLSDAIYYVETTNEGGIGNPVMGKMSGTSEYVSLANSNVPNVKKTSSVSWSKVDVVGAEGDSPTYLSGSEWTVSTGSGSSAKSWAVKDNDGSSSYSCLPSDPKDSATVGVLCDTDAAAGKFTIGGLEYSASGSGVEYTVTEARAPQGYVKSEATYRFTINSDGTVSAISSSDSSQTITGNKITNAKKTSSVSWSKVDVVGAEGDSPTYLSGSEWTVSTGSGSSTKSWAVKDNDGSSSYSCLPSDPKDSATVGVLCDTDAAAGKFTIGGLEYSASGSGVEYTVTEARAPQGYVKSEATYRFTINSDGTVSAISSSDSSQTITGNKITNAKAVTALPKTGSWWTSQRMGLAGLGLVGLSGLGYAITLFLKKRGGARA
jgi:choice-of-anchor A domain-containing protein